jgi:hypothetical protein
MNCNFYVTVDGKRIEGTVDNDKWKDWFKNVWFKASGATQTSLTSQIKSSTYNECWESKLKMYNDHLSQMAATCLPTSKQSQDAQQYQRECITNNPLIQNNLGRFYGNSADSVANYQAIFDNKRGLAESEIVEINNIINTFPRAMTDIQTQIETTKGELKRIDDEIRELEHKTEAEEQQFVDDKKASGKTVKKQKLNVLQDYLLAGFFIAYIFFGLVAIFYVSKMNDYSWGIFGLMTLLVILVGGLMAAVVNYVG